MNDHGYTIERVNLSNVNNFFLRVWSAVNTQDETEKNI